MTSPQRASGPSWAEVEAVALLVPASPLATGEFHRWTTVASVRDFAADVERRLGEFGITATDPARRSDPTARRSAGLVPAELEERMYSRYLRETDPETREFALQVVGPELLDGYAARWEAARLRHTPSLAGLSGVSAASQPVGQGAPPNYDWELWSMATDVVRSVLHGRLREAAADVHALIENPEGLDDAARVRRLADTVGDLHRHAEDAGRVEAAVKHLMESHPSLHSVPAWHDPGVGLMQVEQRLTRLAQSPVPPIIETVARVAREAAELMRINGVVAVPNRSGLTAPADRGGSAESSAAADTAMLDRVAALRDPELRSMLVGLIDPRRDLAPSVGTRWAVVRSLAAQRGAPDPTWVAAENAEHPVAPLQPGTDPAGAARSAPVQVDAAAVTAEVVERVRRRLEADLGQVAQATHDLSPQGVTDALVDLRIEATSALIGVTRAARRLHSAPSAYEIASGLLGNVRPTGRRSTVEREPERPAWSHRPEPGPDSPTQRLG